MAVDTEEAVFKVAEKLQLLPKREVHVAVLKELS